MFSNFANPFSTLDVPLVNAPYEFPQKVNINVTDTNDWATTPEGDIICLNPGKWNALAQFQLVYIGKNTDEIAMIDGFYSINDIPVAGSDATSSVSRYSPKNVLPIALASEFKLGDKLSIYAASTNTNVGICRGFNNDGALDESGNKTNATNVYAPSVIFTLTKISDILNC